MYSRLCSSVARGSVHGSSSPLTHVAPHCECQRPDGAGERQERQVAACERWTSSRHLLSKQWPVCPTLRTQPRASL